MKTKWVLGVLGSALAVWMLSVPAFSDEKNAVNPITPASVSPQEPAMPSTGGTIGFETFGRNLDDLIHLSLMTKQGQGFGINDVIFDLNQKLAKNPKDWDALVSLGHIYRLLGRPVEANQFYQKALSYKPNDFALNVFSGKLSYQLEEVKKSLDHFETAILENPKDADVWAARGAVLLRMRDEQEAELSYERALLLDPGQEEALFVLSSLYQKSGRSREARELLEELARKKPDDQYIQYHLGALLLAQRDPAGAIQIWEKLFMEGVRVPQFLFNLVIAYIDHKEFSKSETILGHLQFFYPREIDIDFLLAETYSGMNRLKEAEAKYREVISLEPSYISAYIGLAAVLERQGNLKERAEVLKQAQQVMASLEEKRAWQAHINQMKSAAQALESKKSS